MRFLLIAFLFVFSGCGFLDDSIFLDDEAYEEKLEIESLELEEMLLFGRGGGGYSSGV